MLPKRLKSVLYVMLQRAGSSIDKARATIVGRYWQTIPSVQRHYSQFDSRQRPLQTVRHECKLVVDHCLLILAWCPWDVGSSAY